MNIIRSSIKSQVLDLKTLPVFSPLKIGVNENVSLGRNLFSHQSLFQGKDDISLKEMTQFQEISP